MKHKFRRTLVTTLAFFAMLLCLSALVLCLSGCSHRGEYTVDYTEYFRYDDVPPNIYINVKIPKLKSNSVHTEEINKEFRDYYLDIYNDYKSVITEYDFKYRENIFIYGLCNEQDDFLCMTVIEKRWYAAPSSAEVKSVFLDLKEDKLYSTEEYMKKVGITSPNMDFLETEFGEHLKWVKTNGVFYINGERILAIQYYTEDDERQPSEIKDTMFYNCETGKWSELFFSDGENFESSFRWYDRTDA